MLWWVPRPRESSPVRHWSASESYPPVPAAASYPARSAVSAQYAWFTTQFSRSAPPLPIVDLPDRPVSLWSWWLSFWCRFLECSEGLEALWSCIAWILDRMVHLDHPASESILFLSSQPAYWEQATMMGPAPPQYFTLAHADHYEWHSPIPSGSWIQSV